MDFINRFLAQGNLPKMVEVTILNPFDIKTVSIEKESIVDIKSLDENKLMEEIKAENKTIAAVSKFFKEFPQDKRARDQILRREIYIKDKYAI